MLELLVRHGAVAAHDDGRGRPGAVFQQGETRVAQGRAQAALAHDEERSPGGQFRPQIFGGGLRCGEHLRRPDGGAERGQLLPILLWRAHGVVGDDGERNPPRRQQLQEGEQAGLWPAARHQRAVQVTDERADVM